MSSSSSSSTTTDVNLKKDFLLSGKTYVNMGLIGEGAHAKVYKVFRSDDMHIFALKELMCETSASQREHDHIANMFATELENLKVTQGLPFIIQALDHSICATDPKRGRKGCCQMIILFEFAEISLREYLDLQPKLNTKFDTALGTPPQIRNQNGSQLANNIVELKNVLYGMLRAVAVLHSVHIVHRDIKPENFVFIKGVLTLIDLGLSAKLQKIYPDKMEMVEEENGEVVGSFPYLAPEINFEEDYLHYTSSVDVWAIGAAAWYMVTKLEIKPSALNYFEVVKMSIPELQDFITRCLSKEPEKRPTALELLDHPFITSNVAHNVLRFYPVN